MSDSANKQRFDVSPDSRKFSAASITAILHYNATLAPQDSITTLADMVALSSSAVAVNQGSTIVISAPENPPKPQLVPEVWYTALAHCQVSMRWRVPC